jgi:uracil DNA glycosylase
MGNILQANSALTRSALPVSKSPTVLDLLLTFHVGRHASGPAPRPPLSVSVVIDRSGSMSGKPIKQAVAAAEVLVGLLEPRDTLSVVVYNSAAETIVAPEKVTNPAAIAKALRKVKATGGTNLHAGWTQGLKHVLGTKGDNLLRRVLLLTDGQANSGITDPKKLIAEAKEQAGKGALTTTLGFGRDFNEDLLIGMAEASGGNFYYIETPEDATQVFHIEGESLTSVSAGGLEVTLVPAGGVVIREALNRYPTLKAREGLRLAVGDVYSAEDKLVAVEIEVPPQARAQKNVPLVEVKYSYEAVADEKAAGKRTEEELTVSANVSKDAASSNFDVLRQVARIRIARAKEVAVTLSDDRRYAEAAKALRAAAEDLRRHELDEEFEIAEEAEQLLYFAAELDKGRLSGNSRKVLRDQSYQGRTRNRLDLSARGAGGGSASGLEKVDSPEGGVELICVHEGGKLQLKVVSAGYDPDHPVLFPRNLREEGASYVVERLEPSRAGTFYRATGTIKRLTNPSKGTAAIDPSADPADPLALTPLFAGGGEPWLPLLKPVIEAQPKAGDFIGPKREQGVVPVRELTFQALKPNPPHRWKVVVFGQNPYPRVESATGIAMFDNSFGNWADSQFGKVVSIRCIIKAAMMWKHRLPKATPIADLRKLLADKNTVQPPGWFQAMLTQGVLLLNASLTANSDGAMTTDQHTAFWKPVVEKLVEEVLRSKEGADEVDRGVVFAWWGAHAKGLRSMVEKLQKKYPKTQVRHLDHCNPAAQGDIFCDGDHFGAINKALKGLGAAEVDWLPSVGWNEGAGAGEDADRMGEFVARTMELHKFYLERLEEVKEEAKVVLPPVVGVMASPALSLLDALTPLTPEVAGLEYFLKRSHQYGEQNVASGGGKLTADQIGALYLYTTGSAFHKRLNAALRDPDREKARPFFGYLRLLISTLGALERYSGSVWRGVAADMRGHYPKGATVTWWGVSSCTGKRSVATSFIGSKGKRTLFEIVPQQAVGIRRFSAFTGEDEYLLAPGAQLKVTDVVKEAGNLFIIKMEELPGERLVS